MIYIPTGSELLDADKVVAHLDLRAGMKIADLGCGAKGHFVFPSAKLVGENGVIYAVDILKSALNNVMSQAKLQNFANVAPIWSDIEVYGGAKEIVDESCDAAYLVNVHAKQTMIKEALRTLMKGGRLLLVDWKAAATPFGPPTKDRISVEEAKKRAAGFNLELESEFEAGPHHWGLIYRKI
jgi:ubiquinone/menaquinone biosynthesis C-methylase UbiE